MRQGAPSLPVFEEHEIDALLTLGFDVSALPTPMNRSGDTYSFRVVELRSRLSVSRNGFIFYKDFYLVVESPELDALRASYYLPKKSWEIDLFEQIGMTQSRE